MATLEQVPTYVSRRNQIIDPLNEDPEEYQLQLEKTASVSPPPDGGLVAWLQVLAAFFIFFNTWGVVNTFGTFQTIYSEKILTTETNSNISWIGSIQGFLLLALSLIAGPLFDKGYCKVMLYSGTVLIVLGMMMTSLCTKYWQFMLAQGICMGIGNGCLFLPGIASLPTYFSTKRGAATGIAAAGSSLGGVIYPILFHKLEPRIGFGWTTRIMGFIMLATMALVIAVTRVRAMPTKARPMLDLKAFQVKTYSVFCLACFFGFAGVYVPFFYIQQYATSKANTDQDLAFYTLAVLNASSIFGRVLPGIVADRMGTLNTLFICSVGTTILGLCWIAIDSTAGIFIFCFFYGFTSGTFVSLQAAAVAHMVPKLYMMGTWIGMIAFISGLGILMGNPVAGAILSNGSWLGVQLYCGVTVAVATALVLTARTAKVGPSVMAKG